MERILIIKHIDKSRDTWTVSSDDVITIWETQRLSTFYGRRYSRIYLDEYWHNKDSEKYIHSVLISMLAMPGCDSEVRWI